MPLKRLGKVLHISQRGSIILRTDKTPPLGVKVVDTRVNEVGIIVDIFGPVKQPYISIRPLKGVKNKHSTSTPAGSKRTTHDPSVLIGQVLYLYKR